MSCLPILEGFNVYLYPVLVSDDIGVSGERLKLFEYRIFCPIKCCKIVLFKPWIKDKFLECFHNF